MSLVSAFIQRVLNRVENAASRAQLRRLRSAGSGIVLGRGVKIEHPECVSLGDRVHLNDHCWLSVLTENRETGNPTITLRPELRIGDGCYIGRFGTLACINRVTIGRDVMISDRVFIGDATHGFARTDLPIRDQYLTSKGSVEIGDGTWIGIGVSIMANVKIGRNCVIGAGSVVVSDIPDFCIAVGAPAKIVRRING
ncbi:MAG: acyltransferase [Burkholderiaceae bacterium]|uniref:acyltransferase n=1 Tax=Polaromonas sp. YR568 TaxID=1855301 RepID=UPI00271C08BA|nr:acyltransferase [Burkholderiaceae bacterium]MDO9316905.1 acyltransferase [Gammaproteobacteria bacterium]